MIISIKCSANLASFQIQLVLSTTSLLKQGKKFENRNSNFYLLSHAETRKKNLWKSILIFLRYDPLPVGEYENNGLIGIKIYDTLIKGISSFYRVGDLVLKMTDNKLIISMKGISKM